MVSGCVSLAIRKKTLRLLRECRQLSTNSDTNQLTLDLYDNDKFVYFGLDTETTGTHPDSEIIQIGIYIFNYHASKYDVGHRGNFHFEPKAFEVNGFTFKRIYDGMPAFEVDEQLEEIMLQASKNLEVPLRNFIPVGFNVGSFDIPLIRRTFPRFSTLLSYRTLDLNAVLACSYRTKSRFDAAKKAAKAYADEMLTHGTIVGATVAHDALYDAAQAIFVLRYLQDIVE